MFQSFLPFFKKFHSEIVLISLALIIALFSSLIFFQNTGWTDEEITLNVGEETNNLPSRIMIDMAGAVNKPGVYETSPGARLKDVIKLAQGINNDADVGFFNRNFNLARYVSDQEKIYIPSTWEINTGYFLENKQTLDYTSAVYNNITTQEQISQETDSLLININTASTAELDKLPGIGTVTAKKIIDNRPYNSIDELLTRKIVNKNVWEQIKGLVIN